MSTNFGAWRSVSAYRACLTALVIISTLGLTACLSEPVPFEDRNGLIENDDGNSGGDIPSNNNNSGTPNPTQDTNTDYVAGYWNAAQTRAVETIAAANNPVPGAYQIDLSNDKSIYLSWTTRSTVNGQLKNDLSVMRARLSANTYNWSQQTDNNYNPVEYVNTTPISLFATNKVRNDGYALWQAGDQIKISEFMGGMGHFMGVATLGEGHVPQILSDAGGNAYLLTQTHVAGGFALNISKRISNTSWTALAELDRVDNINNIQMPDHFLKAMIDGQNNIVAIWLENQNNVTRLMSAVFNTASSTWGASTTIVDSNNMNGFDVAAIDSIGFVAESGTANLHLLLYQNSSVEKAIFSINYNSNSAVNAGWSAPIKQSMSMTNKLIVGDPVYSSSQNGSLVAAWVERQSSVETVMSLRLVNGVWSALTEIQTTAVNTQVQNLGLAMNNDGQTLAAWSESTGNNQRILSSLQKPGQAWAKKELVLDFSNISALKSLSGIMLDDGTPWLVIGTMGAQDPQGVNLALETRVITRTVNINQVTPNTTTHPDDSDGHDHGGSTGGTTDGTTGGTTDGTTGGTTDGTTGGTTDGTTGGTTDGTTGGTTDGTTGGTTDGTTGGTTDGTTGGTTDGTTGGTTDGTNTGNGIIGLWVSPESVLTRTFARSVQAMITAPEIQMTNAGVLFNHWVIKSDFDTASMQYSNQEINMTIRESNASGDSNWTVPGNAFTTPQSYLPSSAIDPRFIVNPISGDGIATWTSVGNIKTSEYMGQMKHFMSSAELTNQTTPVVLPSNSGDEAYLISKTSMTGGFGLRVSSRASADQWSVDAELHRMAASPLSNPNDFIIAAIDGQNNLRVLWVEQQNAILSLQTATYNPVTKTWGVVTEVQTNNVILNKLVSGLVSAPIESNSTSTNVDVLLYQKNAEDHGLFSISFNGSTWGAPMRLDAQSVTNKIASMPAYTKNKSGDIVVAWIERDTTMTATNTSNSANMIMARRFDFVTGWSATEHVAHVPTDADAMEVKVALNTHGEVSLAWVESTSHGSDIMISHLILTNSQWSQKESISHVMNTMGSIQSLSLGIENNIPMMLWVVKSTDAINDTISISRASRLTLFHDAIADVNDGGSSGNGQDNGTDTQPDDGTTIPANVNWTAPVMVLQRTQNATTTSVLTGPHVLLDDLGGSVVHLSSQNSSDNNGTPIKTVDNYVLRSNDQVNWMDVLTTANIFDDLSADAMMDRVRIVPGTGGVYGLIKDNNTLYLARYMVNAGWSKSEIPDVQLNPEQFKNFQLVSDDTGMVTITWNDSSNIYAKHFMVSAATGWLPTRVKPVAAVAILAPHFIDDEGKVHATWLESSDLNDGGFILKMSTYTPMLGWDTVDESGPQGISNSRVKFVDNGTDKMVVTVNLVANTIDTFIQNNDGTWTSKLNVNEKLENDNVSLINLDKIRVHTGGADRFAIVWQELLPSATGDSYIERYKTITVHRMIDANTGMKMSHWSESSQISDALLGLENNLKIVMDSAGVTYAVWTSIDVTNGKSRVYANQAAPAGIWSAVPEMLVEYDIAGGSFADQPAISINSLDEVAIAWTQRMSVGSMAMHHVWTVHNQ